MVAGTTNEHLFSPMVAVSSAQTYVLKSFANVSAITSGELGYYIHEYDAAGNELGGQWKKAITAASVTNGGFTYTPSSATVATASLEAYVTANSGITAYVDNFQWYSTSETDTPTPPVDTTAPVVTNVTITGTTATSTTISWTTDEASTAVINYGTAAAYGSTVNDTVSGTTHSVTLTGLTASTNYQFQIVAKDAANNTNSTSTGSFGTLATGTPGVFGDITADGVVNDDDATILFANWGNAPKAGDLDNNGVVNDDDATLLFANWSK
jgi:hypothetical protein